VTYSQLQVFKDLGDVRQGCPRDTPELLRHLLAVVPHGECAATQRLLFAEHGLDKPISSELDLLRVRSYEAAYEKNEKSRRPELRVIRVVDIGEWDAEFLEAYLGLRNVPFRQGPFITGPDTSFFSIQFRLQLIGFRDTTFTRNSGDFNHAIFGGDPTLDPTSANFGKILRNNGQSNFPRQVQLGIRLSF
jgi:hypothetical protein